MADAILPLVWLGTDTVRSDQWSAPRKTSSAESCVRCVLCNVICMMAKIRKKILCQARTTVYKVEWFPRTQYHSTIPSPVSRRSSFRTRSLYQNLPRPIYLISPPALYSSPRPIATMYSKSFLSALLMASLAVASPALNRRSWCGVHVTQYQKNENGVGGTYEFDATLKDQNGTPIGSVSRQPTPADVTSSLPYVLIITAGNVDSDPVRFDYADQHWASDGSQCSVGAYDSGSRQMDCGFTC